MDRQVRGLLFFRGIGILPMRHGMEARYVFSAKGAAFIAAWGSAPGTDTYKKGQR